MEEMQRKIGRRMSIMMGITISCILSLVGTLLSGHFTIVSYLVSFALSTVISLILGLVVPIKKIGDAIIAKLKLVAGKLPAKIISSLVSTCIYTPIIVLAMITLAFNQANTQIDKQIDILQNDVNNIQQQLVEIEKLTPPEIGRLKGEEAGKLESIENLKTSKPKFAPMYVRSLLTSMLLIIVAVCGFKYNKVLPIVLFTVGGIMFMIVCTSGYLPWYYKDVSLEFVDGAAKLVKEYGPLHIVYLIYVLAYFCLMIFAIAHSIITKKVAEKKHAGLLIAIVLCNIVMWIIEKFIDWNFEFLSVSYILSECMLLFLYWMMQDYVSVNNLPVQVDSSPIIIVDSMTKVDKINKILSMLPEGTTLSARQIDVLGGIIDGKSRKEIAADLFLSEVHHNQDYCPFQQVL